VKVSPSTFAENQTMQKIFIALCLFSAIAAEAQTKEGKVIYERVMQVRRPQGLSPEIANQFPPSRTDNFELLFGNNQSLWRNIPKAEGADGTVMGNGVMFRTVGGIDDLIFFDFTKGTRTDKREMFDNAFLVEDSVRKLSWKLSEETKTILGHQVRKATAQRIGVAYRTSMENGQMKREEYADTSSITAWFSTDFPVATGPQEFQGQLPGIILQLDLNNGRVIYNAVEISPKVSLSTIKEPKGGKRVTQAEYVKERDKMINEMQKNLPAGGNIRIQSN
jgi:GLPGLI family protein